MRLDVFNVEHGACALIETSNLKRVMIDAGHNGTTGWKPGNYLRSQNISLVDKLVISNFDEDHVSGIENLLDYTTPGTLVVNNSISAFAIKLLKRENGMGPGIERLVYVMENIYTGGPPGIEAQNFGDVHFSYFRNAYPTDFNDENNLSLVTFVNAGTLRAVFPGDLERIGWQKLLQVPAFRAELQNVNVFFASHHGRESGYCAEVFNYCTPSVVVISDSSIMYETQKVTELYRKHASGIRSDNNKRYVITTRNDGNMRFTTDTTNWYLKMDSD